MNKDKNKDSGYISPTSDMKYDADGFGMMINFPGLSIREWYAGQALMGFATNPQIFLNIDHIKNREDAFKFLADHAFLMADEMIERSRQ